MLLFSLRHTVAQFDTEALANRVTSILCVATTKIGGPPPEEQ